jgi:hypothetical protein
MYKIIGSDQREYGPIPLEQLRQWVKEGRANAQTQVQAEGETIWKALGSLKEFSAPPVVGPAPGVPPVVASVPQQSCRLATWSMVCGILGFILCFPAIVAIILGHIALVRIRRSNHALTGNGQAIAGLVMGYMCFAFIPVFGLMTAIAVPSFMRARMRAQASTVLNELRQVDAAKDQYALENSKTGEVIPNWSDLTPYLKADSRLAKGGGKDSLGNPISINEVSARLRVSQASKDALSDATGGDAFWGPFS